MYNVIYDFFGFNKIIFVFINKITNFGAIPNIVKIVSQLFFIGNFAVYYFIICLFCYFKLKKLPSPEINFWPIYNNLVKAGTCYALFGFIYAFLKFAINLPRPFCSLSSTEFITIIDTTNERCLSSFPSAHTGLAIIIAYYLYPHLKKYQQILIFLLIPAVAISRITLAMHYPADIIYSAIISAIIILLSNKIVDLSQNQIVQPVGYFILKKIFLQKL
jgi:membrane-associated phospholipid phosphatase